jgi:hypothetical protein
MESYKLSRSMTKKFLNKRSIVVESSLNADEDKNDIIDENPMDIVLDDESIAQLSTADHQYWNCNALAENRMFLEEDVSSIKKISPTFNIIYLLK